MTRKNLRYREYEPVDSLVYLIKGHKLYKIGYSTNFQKRLKELQIGNEYPLEVVYLIHCDNPRDLEKRLHWYFRKKLVAGEWFRLSRKDVLDIGTL